MASTEELIQQYGKAHRDWYQDQHSRVKCDLANRLQRRIERLPLSGSEVDAYQQEHWSTTYVIPGV